MRGGHTERERSMPTLVAVVVWGCSVEIDAVLEWRNMQPAPSCTSGYLRDRHRRRILPSMARRLLKQYNMGAAQGCGVPLFAASL